MKFSVEMRGVITVLIASLLWLLLALLFNSGCFGVVVMAAILLLFAWFAYGGEW